MIVKPYVGTYKQLLEFLKTNHYLSDKRFPFLRAYGLYEQDILMGICTFSPVSGPKTISKYFKIPYKIVELSRLAISINTKNLASKFASECIRLEKKLGVEAILSFADSSRHIGTIYQAMNFKYIGKTANQRDTYLIVNGVCKKLGRRKKPIGAETVSLTRPKKHIYILPLYKHIKLTKPLVTYPKSNI